MALDVTTIDCTALDEGDLAEMADLCADNAAGYDLETLTKVRDEWVLITRVRETDSEKLRAFSMSTLERIGGTPCILLGVGFVARNSRREAVIKALMFGNYHRALMAFPDEDVLVGTRLATAGGYDAYKVLQDIVPRPDHGANGEERQWGRRLAKRFGIDPDHYEAPAFTVRGDGSAPLFLDYETAKPESVDAEVAAQFDHIDASNGDALITFGWAMAEELLKYQRV